MEEPFREREQTMARKNILLTCVWKEVSWNFPVSGTAF